MARILAVDENAVILDILVQILTTEGHEILVASHLDQALEQLHSTSVDLVITDYTATKVLGGGEGLQRLAAAAQGASIILLTGYGGRDELQSLLGTTVDDIIGKPFNIAELADHVRACLERQAS
jgi:DNA-binding response OmpR family regulator